MGVTSPLSILLAEWFIEVQLLLLACNKLFFFCMLPLSAHVIRQVYSSAKPHECSKHSQRKTVKAAAAKPQWTYVFLIKSKDKKEEVKIGHLKVYAICAAVVLLSSVKSPEILFSWVMLISDARCKHYPFVFHHWIIASQIRRSTQRQDIKALRQLKQKVGYGAATRYQEDVILRLQSKFSMLSFILVSIQVRCLFRSHPASC